MIISTCGFGSTGSSAVADYLLECQNVQAFDAIEFTLTTMVDGLEDLEYHVMQRNTRCFSSVYAIKRFRLAILNCCREWKKCTGVKKKDIMKMTDAFINEIVQVSFIGDSPLIGKNSFWKHYLGYSLFIHRFIFPLEKKGILKKNHNYYPFEKIEVSIKPSNFYEASKKYVEGILKLMGCSFDKILVLDQAFSGNDPAKSFPFFNDPYAIVVDRDPRDLFIFAKEKLLSRGRFMPTDDVNKFITYYKIMRQSQPYKNGSARIMSIHFEDLVYNYEETTEKIDSFLGVKNIKPKSIFNPELSVANTNLKNRFPQYEKEISIIESELSDYLFDFSKYPEVVGSKKMFFGKSPLNKQ